MVSIFLASQRIDKDNKIKELIENNQNKDIMLMTPEQISLSVEQKIQRSDTKNTTVLSFKRLSTQIFKKHGKIQGEYATNISKLIIMEQTLNELEDDLKVYKKNIKKPGFVTLAQETIENIKRASINFEDYDDIEISENKKLEEKINDISKIYRVYNSILLSLYKDPSDDIKRARLLAEKNNFFKGKLIIFDYFSSFSKEQYELIETMSKQTDVIFMLNYQDKPPFKTVIDTIENIKRTCINVGAKVKKEEKLENKEKIYENPADFFVYNRKNEVNKRKGETKTEIYLSQNEYEEAELISSKIIKYTKSGIRYNEMIVLLSNLDEYKNAIKSSFKRNKIPYYIDEKKKINEFSIINCCASLLNASINYSIESILNLIKNDLTKYNTEQTSIFENYLYTWEINSKTIKNKFENNPRGFIPLNEQTEEDNENLKIAEQIREDVMNIIKIMRNSKNSSKEISLSILNAFEVLKLKEKLSANIKSSDEENANQKKRSWDIFINIIEEIVKNTKNIDITLSRYKTILDTVISQTEVGQTPQTIDSILIGDINKTLSMPKKIVFILGANENDFPKVPNNDNMFTNTEIEKLNDLDIKISKTQEDIYNANILKAFEAMNFATDKLILSARLNNTAGGAVYLSQIVYNAIKQLGDEIVHLKDNEDIIELSQTKESAFMNLIMNYKSNKENIDELKEYFKCDKKYKNILKEIDNKNEKEYIEIKNKKTLDKLLSYNTSSTRIEAFYNCPFNYYCKYLMNIKTMPTTRLNAPSLGLIIHRILENVISKEDFLSLTKNDIKRSIKDELDKYLNDNLGGEKGKTNRFMKLYYNNLNLILILCQNIQNELNNSKYKPIGYEVKIGDDKVKLLNIELNNNKSIKVSGKIDRIDLCEIDNKKYIRVIDYKTGNKRLDFGEIYNGLNMQMILYLMAIYKSSKQHKKDIIPAGILYMPASGNLKEYIVNKRDSKTDKKDELIQKGFRANGIILEDEKNIRAMEDIKPGEAGKYLGIRVLKNGDINKVDAARFLVSTIEMESLFNFVENQVKEMYKILSRGKVDKKPIINLKKRSTCEYCEYKEACNHEESIDDKQIVSLNKEEFFNLQKENKERQVEDK